MVRSQENITRILQQNFKTDSENKVWVGDITYIKTVLGWVYLAAILDLYNREVIGYAISTKIFGTICAINFDRFI